MQSDPLADPLLADVPVVDGKKVLEPCVLERAVGGGAMGRVYKARHKNLGVDVAVKVLKKELARQDAEFVERFRREAQSAALIAHSNVVRVFDVSECAGVHYLVMEFVAGEDVRQRIERGGRLSAVEAAQIAHGAARGLAAAHRRGMVHRDIKPDNIMVSSEGQVKVTDLGLARPGEGPGLTRSNVVLGTPQYMPPEQWDGASQVGPQADVWALGAVLYYMLTGEHAVKGKSFAEVHRAVRQPLPDARQLRPDLDGGLADIIAACTHPDPEQRFPSAVELVDALDPLVGSGLPAGSLPSDIAVERTMMVGSELRSSLGVPSSSAAEVERTVPELARTVPELERTLPELERTVVHSEEGEPPGSAKRIQGLVFALLGLVVAGAAIAVVLLRDGASAQQFAVVLEGDWPAEGPLYVSEPTFELRLRVSPADVRTLTYSVSGQSYEVQTDAAGRASASFALEADGEYPLRVGGAGVESLERSLVRDTRAPSLLRAEPEAASELDLDAALRVSLVFDEEIAGGTLGGELLERGADARQWGRSLRTPAVPGPFELSWSVRDRAGMRAEGQLSWSAGLGAAAPWEGALAPGSLQHTRETSFAYRGRLRQVDASRLSLRLDDRELELELGADGSFDELLQLTEGVHRLELLVDGTSAGAPAVLIVDTTPPGLRVLEPESLHLRGDSVRWRLALEDEHPAAIRLDGVELERQADGSFLSEPVALTQEGVRSFDVELSDLAGHRVQERLELVVDRRPPEVVSFSRTPEGPLAPGQAVQVEVQFNEPVSELSVGGSAASVLDPPTRARAIAYAPQTLGRQAVVWRALDLAGNEASESFDVLVQDPWGDAPDSLREAFEILDPEWVQDGERSFPARIRHLRSGVAMRFVPGGEFVLGSPASDPERQATERAVRVRCSGFYMAERETSRREWEDGHGGDLIADEFDDNRDYPARGMSWEEAQAWCEALGLLLPSEAQWEYAASGPEDRRYPWGMEFETGRCVSGEDEGAADSPFPEFVGTLGPEGVSWCGIQNLAGNVREWCRDRYDPDYAGIEDGALDPVVSEGTALRARRGGYYTSRARECRNAARFPDSPGKRNLATGFRCVVELE